MNGEKIKVDSESEKVQLSSLQEMLKSAYVRLTLWWSDRGYHWKKTCWNRNPEVNRELEKKVLELVKVNKKLDAFNYTVSHDLKEPPISLIY